MELKKILLSGVASFFVARFCFAALFCFVSRVFVAGSLGNLVFCRLFGPSCFFVAPLLGGSLGHFCCLVARGAVLFLGQVFGIFLKKPKAGFLGGLPIGWQNSTG